MSDTNLPPEKLKAATQNEQNDGCLIVKNRPLADIHPKFSNGNSLRESGQSISANQLALPAAIHNLYFPFCWTTPYVRMTGTVSCYLEDCRQIINEADKGSKVAARINAAPCLSVHFRF